MTTPTTTMTIEQEIDAGNAELHAAVAADPGPVIEHFAVDGPVRRALVRHGVHGADDLLPVPPALLPRTVVADLGRRHRALRQALDIVFDGRLQGSWTLLAEALRLEPATRRYVEGARRPRWLTIARPDVVLAGDRAVIVEPNAGTSCGFAAEADVLARVYAAAPVIGDVLRRSGARGPATVPALADHLRTRMVAAGGEPSGLVVVTELAADLDAEAPAYELLARELRRVGVRAEVGAVEDLDIDADGVALDGQRCSAIYRLAAEEPDPDANHRLLAPLLDAGRAGAVVVVDELEDAIAANKTILATLSEELDAGRLPAALSAELHGFIPWTRVLEEGWVTASSVQVDLVPWCQARQHDLVLKPGAGFSGRGVVVGEEVDAATWAGALEHALAATEAWIVQRVARSAPTRSSIVRGRRLLVEETYVDYGYFAVGDGVPTGVIRKHAPFGTPTRRVKQAGTTPVFVV